MTFAQLSVIAEAAAAAVVTSNASISVPERVERAVREAVWQTGREFVRPIPIYEVD